MSTQGQPVSAAVSLRILHVIPSLSPARGGPAIVLRQIMSGLSEKGVTVHAVATDDDGPDKRLTVSHGVPIADSGGACYCFPRQTGFYSFSWPLTQWLRRHVAEYDVVHIHALFSYPSVIAAWLSWRCGTPYLLRPLGTLAQWGLSARRPWLKAISLRCIEAPLMRRAAAVQATSEQERGEILAACPGCRTVVIPNPIAAPGEPLLRPARARPQNILFLSRIDPKKGLEILLAAFSVVGADAPHLRLVIAGDGEPAYVESIHRLAAGLPVREQIVFAGNVEAEAKRRLFAEADLFVLPSWAENFGVAVAEAMAHSIPVLISPNVGIHNEVTSAGAGKTAECAVEPLARSLHQMLDAPEELQRMGENGRRLALTLYAPDVVAAQLIAAYAAARRA